MLAALSGFIRRAALPLASVLAPWTASSTYRVPAGSERGPQSPLNMIAASRAGRSLVEDCTMRSDTRAVLLVTLGCLALLTPDSTAAQPGGKVSKRPLRPRPCLDLPEEILEQMFGRQSVGVLSAFHHALQLAPLQEDNRTCPSAGRPAAEPSARLPVNILSTSPWAYRISHSPTRFPRYIPEAYCLCKGCLTGPLGEESLLYRSTPVYMPSVILRRTASCSGGHYAYTESYVSIAVGCTCVPNVDKEAHSSNSSLDKAEIKASDSSPDKHS